MKRTPTSNATALKVFRFLVLPLLMASVAMPQAPSALARSDRVIIKGLPSVNQWYNLSCEYAAAAAVTLYWGNLVSQSNFIREVPKSPNPHLGFRGNINAPFGGLTNYGVYAEALVPVLERRGYNATVYYGGLSQLKAEITAGHPMVVWITVGKYVSRPVYRRSYDGDSFKLVPGEHSVVVYGYDGGGVYVMDVSDGGFYYTEWDSFLTRWGYFDEMMLAITP